MPIKIIGGILRSYLLETNPHKATRPTSVMLKRKIFDAFQNHQNKIFIDTCAGSGGIGFESWSRGAQRVFLVEKNKSSFHYIKKNYEKIKRNYKNELDERPIELINDRIESWINIFVKLYLGFSLEQKKEIIFFLDPPYENLDLYYMVIEKVKKMSYKGEFWIESDDKKGLSVNELKNEFSDIEKIYFHSTRYIARIKF